jgi:hypothetical protein
MIMNSRVRPVLTSLLVAALVSCNGTPASKRFLTVEYLTGTDEHAQPLPMSEFAEPGNARATDSQFKGVLKLVDPEEHGDLSIVHDPLDLVEERLNPISHLPRFEFGFVRRGADLIPVRRGVIRTEHPYWEYILQPGRVWSEVGDGSWSRAALPFSLQERSANCTHNGMLTWLFDKEGNVSRVAYQISSETCGYFKVNMWGVVPAAFESGDVAGAAEAITRLDAHRAARLPVKPIAMLAEDYPGVDPENIGTVGGVKAEDMTVYGLVVDGVHYRGGCGTRHGLYPFCDELALPSYSTAKSIFAGVALMRMEKRHPGIASQSIASLVPECPGDRWADVSLENALDMATGNYKETAWDIDEDSVPHVIFLDDDKHATKIEFACTHFKRRAEPGTEWVYHTSDTYVLGTAMRNYIAQRHDSSIDFYEHVIAGPIWDHLKLSPLLDDTKRTYDEAAQPFTGYGLTYEADDIVRIARWLSQEHAVIDGEPDLDEDMLSAALQRNVDEPGYVTSKPSDRALRYNNGFWGWNAAPTLGCDEHVWVPFMSGYGGITVAMFPNDTIYYYFSDGYVQRWASAAVESSKISDLCQ